MRSCSIALASRAFATICSRRSDRLLLLAVGQMCAAFPRFVDHSLRIGVGLGEDLSITLLGFRELLFDLLRIQQAFGDSLSPLFQDTEDRLVGKAAQQERDDREADYLREKQPRIPAEGFGGFLGGIRRTPLLAWRDSLGQA